MKEVHISTEYIALDQMLKYEGLVATGGEAKLLIKEEEIWVNGEPCNIIRKKLYPGDRVDVPDKGSFVIVKR